MFYSRHLNANLHIKAVDVLCIFQKRGCCTSILSRPLSSVVTSSAVTSWVRTPPPCTICSHSLGHPKRASFDSSIHDPKPRHFLQNRGLNVAFCNISDPPLIRTFYAITSLVAELYPPWHQESQDAGTFCIEAATMPLHSRVLPLSGFTPRPASGGCTPDPRRLSWGHQKPISLSVIAVRH